MEEEKTGYFKNEKNQYGSRRYVTNAQIKAEKEKRNRVGLFVFLFLLLVIAVSSYFIIRNLNADEESQIKNANSDSNELSRSIVDVDPGMIPEYSGADIIELNQDTPSFTEYDYNHITGENFSDLDSLGRCGTATAMIDRTMMPTEERGEIGSVKPSGWNQKKYPGIVDSEPPYLYNRCHLIAYALTGQNANEENLITGTRYLNVDLMLPYEIKVARYLDNSDNHVLYRVSPLFRDNELVARGVEIEAYSVEDNGEGVCFHVFLYNVQPGITIDYGSGDSKEE